MAENSKEKYCKYYTSANRKGGNYYTNGVFDQDKSMAVEAESQWLRGEPSAKVLASFRALKLKDDNVPEGLKATLYAVYCDVYGKGKNGFIEFYNSLY